MGRQFHFLTCSYTSWHILLQHSLKRFTTSTSITWQNKTSHFSFPSTSSFEQSCSSYSHSNAGVVSDTMPIYTSRLYQGCAASSCRTPVRSNFFTFLSLLKLSPTSGPNDGSLFSLGFLYSDSFFPFLSFLQHKREYCSNSLFHISTLKSSELPHQKQVLKSF